MLNSILKRWWDVILMVLLLLITNGHLLGVNSPFPFLLTIDGIAEGEYYRFITHAFLHTSWYHFLLDSSAFFFLYTMVSKSPKERLWVFMFSLSGSLLGACIGTSWLLPEGLCGLSGSAHGIIIWVSFILQGKTRTGWESVLYSMAILFTLAKSIYEVYTGGVLFSSLHIGNVGSPVVSCHLGSTLFILLIYPLYRYVITTNNKKRMRSISQRSL